MGKKIIAITGGEGFVGTHLVEKLSERQEFLLRLFDRKKHNLLDSKTLKSFLSGTHSVIHLAGVNQDSTENIFRVNTVGTAGLIEGIERYAPGIQVIFSSTFQVYHLDSPYAISKRCAEDLLNCYARKGTLAATILRFSNIYGPGCKPFYNSVMATFVHLVSNNKPLEINGDGSAKRDYVYISDVVDAIEKSITVKQQNKSETIAICSGKQHSLKTIINALKRIAQKPVSVRYNKSNASGISYRTHSYEKASNLLQWRPTVSLEEGLSKYVKSEAGR